MRRCGVVIGLIGVAAGCVAYALVSLVICLTIAVPFGLLFVLDALVGERAPTPVMTVVPPAPPRQPVAVPSNRRLAA
jgi:hypothetical protein